AQRLGWSISSATVIGMFSLIIVQSRRNARLQAERQAADAENRVKQEEMEKRLKLQERLLEEEKLRSHQDSMITAMASDYRSVYHVDFEKDEAICYRSDPDDTSDERYGAGDVFPYYEQFSNYGKKYVDEAYREGFLNFIDPENIRKGLKKEKILAYRYLVNRGGKPQYEMIRAAGVTEKGEEEEIKQAGIGFTIIDEEMRETMAKNEALSDALKAAEQANKAKSAFLSNMSHEIRTPMNAIIGLDSIALNDPETPEKTKTYLHKIGASADHLLGLINDILDMSRIESGRLTLKHEEFSFRKLIEAINTMFSSQCMDKGLEYSCRILNDVDDHYIGDSMKLRQVLINILGNAVKFTPEGGKVSMEVEKKASYEGKTALCFTIADTGIGMSKDFLPKIFETFTQEDSSSTSKYGSSGLGMAITKNIVEMMNGNIEVESEKGKGSTFRVTVTLEECAHRVQDEESEIAVKEMNVLIVDDDDIALKHAALILEKEGVHCDCVLCGQEAIDKVKLSAARRRHYDLILVDWKMPDMDGIETTRKIREIIGDESAIIILTAYKWDDVMEEAIEAGVDSFVAKPLFAGAVIEEFRSAMALRKS
ncbi:MAG: response regulator, partial [Erysipelotrichaceae bacterium]|nr:response regulator [Erysipelotrichaceae bacterium]